MSNKRKFYRIILNVVSNYLILNLSFLKPSYIGGPKKENEYLLKNPLSNRGLEGEFSRPNQLLLTFEFTSISQRQTVPIKSSIRLYLF